MKKSAEEKNKLIREKREEKKDIQSFNQMVALAKRKDALVEVKIINRNNFF